MSLDPVRTTLDNGVTLLVKQAATTPAVAISLSIRAGSIADRGTATRSAADIAEELDSRGITLTIIVTRHLFSIGCRCLSEDFQPVLALLGDIVMSPSLPEEEIAIRKGEVFE